MNDFTPHQIALIAISPLPLLLLCAVWSDVKSHRIPNGLVLFGICLGLLLNCTMPEGNGFVSSLPGALGLKRSLAGLGLGFLIMLPMYVLRAMGAGDAKLIAMIGVYLGPNAVIGAVLLTFIAGGFLTLFVVLRNGTVGLLIGNLRTMLVGGFLKATFLHELPTMEAAPVSAGKLPYGIAIAVGTLTYIALEHGGRMNFLKFF